MEPRLAGIFNRRHKHCDDGFSLVELVVAMFIIGGVLLSLVTLQTKAMVSIAQAKERQQATAIANEVLEQLRALPWRSITNGPAAYDPKFVSGDKLEIPGEPITDGMLVKRGVAATPIDSNDPAHGSPLDGVGGTNLTLHTDPALPGFEFKAYSFVTQKPIGAGEPYNLTVVVEWTPRGESETRRVVAHTTSFDTKSGCGDVDTRPYATACQDFFVTQASASAPALSITGAPVIEEGEAPEPGPYEILPGSNVSQISVSGASVGVTIDSAQSTKVRSNVSSGSVSVYDLDRNDTTQSSDSATATASDSVTSNYKPDDPQPMPPANLDERIISSGDIRLSVIPGTRNGAANASTTTDCISVGATAHPCGIAWISTTEQSVKLQIGSDERIVLAKFAETKITAQGARFPGGTAVAGNALHCGAIPLTGSGCAEGRANMDAFRAAFEGVGVLTNHAPGSSAGRGFNLTTGAEDAHRGWNSDFETSDADWTSVPDLDPKSLIESRTLAPIVIRNTEDLLITASPIITVDPLSEHSASADPECRSEACSGRGTADAVLVAITYYVKHGTTETSFTLNASLGDARTSATYKAAPEAWEDVA